ncbi:uncharacterized protein PFL1_04880 [Pseudozyma flocculosa PF-1]|uniref:Uncharacterized protein n=1 Tax=Pseudozyma flocculosa PF-1 TaxID=1277687 RepID=A0A061H516_9BASI|nr:uncharacterized protein PFL1_04880 [Pseudozyma flocculosa PF-1]EPQ27743.1 hypothetical protein PFL1_04880 [Pseudozyma flocculosa PF-1]
MAADLRHQLGAAIPRPHCPHAAAVAAYRSALDNLESISAAPIPAASHGHRNHLEHLEQSFLAIPSAKGARDALERYTRHAHYAGLDADYHLALQVLDEWAGLLGIDLPDNRTQLVFDAGSNESKDHVQGKGHATGPRAWTDTYSVWLNYPINSSLTLSRPRPSDGDDDQPAPEPYFTAALKEDVLDQDPTSAKGVPTFHGYSASGSASGQIVYAGMGRREDFDGLAARGIDVRGKVVLVSYGGVFRGLKVRAAQEAGAVACLIYTDPIEDGNVTVGNGYAAYPDGPARHPSAVQRGSVQGLSIYPGDPATPEKPSYRNATRLDPDTADSLPKIPSLPLSYQDARPLLESLRGKGVPARDINDRMPGALPGIEYWTGPSDDVAHVENHVDLEVRDIWNTYAVLPGLVDSEVVIMGNHRDAWTFGAADPNSGTAAFHETIKGLGELYRRGWRPLRTIMFASWDAEEYGLVGSTEFGEDHAEWIRDNAVAYHNADVSVSGSQFHAFASPSLAGLLQHSAASVADPNAQGGDAGTGAGAGANITLDTVSPLGSGSDFTVFLQYLGIASTDMGYSARAGGTDPVYMYHSNYDSFYWMDKFGDPGFRRHEAASKVLGLAAIRTAASLFSPIDVKAYAAKLEAYLDDVDKVARDGDGAGVLGGRVDVDLRRVRRAIRHVLGRVRRLNEKVRLFEQGFIDPQGLPGRTWYKHLGVAPGRWLGYGATTLPGLTESITLDGGRGAQHEADRLAKHLEAMARRLQRH